MLKRESAGEESIYMDFSFHVSNQALDKHNHPWIQIHSREGGPQEFMVNSIEGFLKIQFHDLDDILISSRHMLLA